MGFFVRYFRFLALLCSFYVLFNRDLFSEEFISFESINKIINIDLSHEASLEDGKIKRTLSFNFRNTSSEDIELVSAKESCSCVSALAIPRRYRSNESGEITVAFLGGAVNSRGKAFIDVFFNKNGQEIAKKLFVEYIIKSPLLIQSQHISWERGENLSVKAVDISFGDSTAITQIGLKDENFSLFERLLSGGRRIYLLPKKKFGVLFDTVLISTDSESPKIKKIQIDLFAWPQVD